MNKYTSKGLASILASMMRGMNPRRASTPLVFVAAMGGITLLPSLGFSQQANPPQVFVQEVARSLAGDTDPATPMLAQDCVPRPGYTCILLDDVVQVPLACPVASDATPDQVLAGKIESTRIALRHISHTVHAFGRRLTRVEGNVAQLDHRVNTVSLIQRTALGCTQAMSDQDCLEQSASYHQYWSEIEPAIRAARDATVDEAQAELRGDYDTLHTEVATLITSVDELRRGLAAETTARVEGDRAINARLDAARGRQWIGPSVGLFTSSCPNDHNCWTGVTGGFGYAGRPVSDSWFGVTGSLDLGHLWGRSGAYDGFLISVRATLGYQSPSNRWGIGIGGQLMAMLTLQTDGGMAFMGGGPMVAGWYKPTDWIRVGLEVGGMFGTVRVAGEREATGHGEDHSAFTGRGFLEIPIKAL